MNLYEKSLAQLEKKTPIYRYSIVREPISDRAKHLAGLEKERWRAFKQKGAVVRGGHSSFPSQASFTFYYDDPDETEDERLRIVRQLAAGAWVEIGVTNCVIAKFARSGLGYLIDKDFKVKITKEDLRK